jgi:hypothetical protein
MSISIIGKIQVRKDTTANWNYINPILPDRVWGHEENGSVPVGSKLGDGVTHWDLLPYWYGGGPSSVPISASAIANSTPVPLVVNFTTLGVSLPGYQAYDNTLNQYDNTIKVVISGTNISFYGIDNGAGNFLDNYTFLVFRH